MSLYDMKLDPQLLIRFWWTLFIKGTTDVRGENIDSCDTGVDNIGNQEPGEGNPFEVKINYGYMYTKVGIPCDFWVRLQAPSWVYFPNNFSYNEWILVGPGSDSPELKTTTEEFLWHV